MGHLQDFGGVLLFDSRSNERISMQKTVSYYDKNVHFGL